MEKIVCENLFCERGDFSLYLEELHIHEGEKIALLGENGCGKTTLLQALNGVLPIGDGRLSYSSALWAGEARLGKNVSSTERSNFMAYLPQEADVLFNLTVAELLALSLDNARLVQEKERENILHATEMVTFQERIFHSLSVGEKRRAMVARVLCRDCPFILLDEPTAPLDLRHATQLMRYMAGMPRTIIAAIHDINLAIRYFDRFLLMKKGKILFDRSKDCLHVDELEEIYGIGLTNHGGYFIPAL